MGLVLCSHWMEDGSEKPIAFAARSLFQAERKYSQLEKEGLAVVFGVSKFQLYLLGRNFTILSDHNRCNTSSAQTEPFHLWHHHGFNVGC